MRIDLYGTAVLLDDDVVTNGQAKPSPFTGRFCRKERVEQLFLNLRRNTGAVVAYSDFDTLAQILGRGSKRRFVVATICFGFTLCCRVETIRDQVEQRPRNLLWEQVDLTSGRVKGLLKGDIEALLLGSRPMIGEVEALLDQGVDIDRPVLSGALT